MNLLYLTILLPLIGFLLLAFSRGQGSENTAAIVGVGSIGLAALVTVYVAMDFLTQKAAGVPLFEQSLWNWMTVGNFNIGVILSLTMLSVVIGVGFFIHMFASWYMRGEEGYSRFFAYTNLFIASMVVLVLADNLLLMYLGWEGVGLCSYLLIGFYLQKSGQWCGGDESLHCDPRWRRVPGVRAVYPLQRAGHPKYP